jgi:hypothetical protein
VRREARERRSKGGKRSADVRANASNPDPTRPDVLSERGLDPPNPRRAGAQRSAGTNPRAVGTNLRAVNVDAVMTGTDTQCKVCRGEEWADLGKGYDERCVCTFAPGPA